jgi:hypothetical protein
MRCKGRIDLYCTPAIWQAMDGGQQWRLYNLRSPRILALAVFS